MRATLTAALLTASVTAVAGLALRAPDAATGVIGLAAVTAMAAWLSGQFSTDDEAGLVLSNPAWALALSLRGRYGLTNILPLWAAQVVAAVVVGLALDAGSTALADAMSWPSLGLLAAAVIAGLIVIPATWVLVLADAYGNEAAAGVPVLVTAAALPLNLLGALNPAVVLGLAVAGFIDWPLATVTVITVLSGAVVGAYSSRLFVPAAE